MGWNLHVVGSEIKDDVKLAVHDFAIALKKAGHVVDSVIFTDDNGQQNLTPVARAAEEVAEIAGVKKSQIQAAIKVIEDALDAANEFADKLADDTATDPVPAPTIVPALVPVSSPVPVSTPAVVPTVDDETVTAPNNTPPPAPAPEVQMPDTTA